MNALQVPGRIQLLVTGARGAIGLDVVDTVVGNFLVWDAERRVRSASGTGADAGLRTDLASTSGAPLVGTNDGRSVQTRLDMVDQSIIANPLGNSSASKTSLWTPIQTKQANAPYREFGEVRTFYVSHGYQASPANPDIYGKIQSYRAVTLASGAPDGWVDNLLLRHETNDAINTHVAELDYDIISSNKYGFGLSGGGTLANGQRSDGSPIGNYSAVGHAVTGRTINGGRITTAYLAASIDGSWATNGFACASGIAYASFLSASAAQYGFMASGSHIDGFNTELALCSGAALQMRNGHKVQSLKADGTSRGTLLATSGDSMFIGTAGSVQEWQNCYFGTNVLFLSDNAFTIGTSAQRASNVYSANGVITSSDERLKTFRNGDGALTDAELAAAKEIAATICVFQFNDAIDKKGSEARQHIGVNAQEVGAIITEHGLDPDHYGFFCHDAWDKTEAVDPVEEIRDETGKVIAPATDGRPEIPAGDRYSIRYDQLALFIAAAQERRLVALEQKQ